MLTEFLLNELNISSETFLTVPGEVTFSSLFTLKEFSPVEV
jgi:hypothetical protein